LYFSSASRAGSASRDARICKYIVPGRISETATTGVADAEGVAAPGRVVLAGWGVEAAAGGLEGAAGEVRGAAGVVSRGAALGGLLAAASCVPGVPGSVAAALEGLSAAVVDLAAFGDVAACEGRDAVADGRSREGAAGPPAAAGGLLRASRAEGSADPAGFGEAAGSPAA
jgi:hypothetical protein